MKSKQVQLIVLGVAVVALVGMVLRSTRQDSSASNEAARLVRTANLDDDSLIEDAPTVQRERPAGGAPQSASRLGNAEATTDEAPSESADEEKTKRKTKKGRSKRSDRQKPDSESDREDTPVAKPKGRKVQLSGKQIRKGGP